MKTKVFLCVLFVVVALLVGCTKNVYYTTPSTQQNEPGYQEVTPQNTPQGITLTAAEERELVKRWMQMYDAFDPRTDDLDESMEFFNVRGLHPIKIFRGNMIFYEESYGYLYFPDFEDDLRTLPHPVPDNELPTLAKKHHGEAVVTTFNEKWAFNFQSLSDMENFLIELWST